MIQPSSSEDIQTSGPDVTSIPAHGTTARTLQRFTNLFPAGQFLRYVCVGFGNTVFGYVAYVTLLTLLNTVLPERWLYLTVILASVLAMPLNITFSYLGYKFFVFRTHGNYLREWLKCFAVYGTGMIPGLVALSALTRVLQSFIHRHGAVLHLWRQAVERHFHGHSLVLLHRFDTGKAMAGYVAGAIVIGVSTIYSFIGHKKITFRANSAR